MKTNALLTLLVGLLTSAYGQGYVDLTNISNNSGDPAATSNGLFWLSVGGGMPTLINQDFNAAFYGGPTSNSLALFAIFLLSDGTAIHDNIFGPGKFSDPGGNACPISGALTSAFFQIQAWTGNFNSYAAAVSGGGFAEQSPVFVNAVDVPPGFAPNLMSMPAMVLSVPEPSAFSLLLLGFAGILFCRRGN